MKPNETAMTVRVPRNLKQDYQAIAEQREMSLTQLTKQLMREAVRRHELPDNLLGAN